MVEYSSMGIPREIAVKHGGLLLGLAQWAALCAMAWIVLGRTW